MATNAAWCGLYRPPDAESEACAQQMGQSVQDRVGTRDGVIAQYRAWLLRRPELMAALQKLRGKDLAYWCAPERCHGEVLLELANA